MAGNTAMEHRMQPANSWSGAAQFLTWTKPVWCQLELGWCLPALHPQVVPSVDVVVNHRLVNPPSVSPPKCDFEWLRVKDSEAVACG